MRLIKILIFLITLAGIVLFAGTTKVRADYCAAQRLQSLYFADANECVAGYTCDKVLRDATVTCNLTTCRSNASNYVGGAKCNYNSEDARWECLGGTYKDASAGCWVLEDTPTPTPAPPPPPTPTPTPVPNPSCTSAGPPGNPTVTGNPATYYVYAYGVNNATSVSFPTWSAENGQDDIVWYPGTNLGGGTWRGTVNFANHASYGQFYVHVYMYGISTVFCGTADFIRATPSCTVDLLPASASISLGLSASFIASVVPSNGSVSQVNFLSGNTAIATVSPASDTTVVYLTEATGVGVGSTTIRAGVIMSGAERCFDTSAITFTPPGPWWQVVDSDVTTNGDIVSRIYPAGTKFILDGLGGYPGVAVYGAQAVFGNGTVSSKGWLANTTSAWLTKKTYDYNYFKNLVPSTWWDGKTTTGATISTANYFRTEGAAVNGYKLFYRSGNLTINATQDMLGQRAILLLDGGDLTINNNISLTDGSGFFMAIVKGNIIINPAVASLEGFYSADNQFRTGTGSVPLTVRGSVAGLGGVSLQRNLQAGNTTTPAELFEYAPDLIFTYPSKLSVRKMRWKEVAP